MPRAGPGMRLGLFGGTFDPPHIGHLVLAEWAWESLALDRLWCLRLVFTRTKQLKQLAQKRDYLRVR